MSVHQTPIANALRWKRSRQDWSQGVFDFWRRRKLEEKTANENYDPSGNRMPQRHSQSVGLRFGGPGGLQSTYALSSSAKADDPVRRDIAGGIETLRRTGCPACAGHDGKMRNTSLPDRQITCVPNFLVQPSREKYSASLTTQITLIVPSSHPRHEGRIAIVTDVGMGCGGRGPHHARE